MRTLEANFLRGSITPLITPFVGDAVSYDEYAFLVDRHVREGGHGVLVNGTSAEPSTLSVAERNRLVDVAIEVGKGRTQIVAATGSQSFAETVTLTEHAARAGVDALLIVTPYYIRPPQRGLAAYFTELGKRTDLPLLIYHIPGRAAVSIDVDTLCRIRDATPTLVGMKHAAPELSIVTESLKRLGPQFRIFVGLEELSLPMMALGACGLMNAVGNLVPRRIADLYEAVASGNLARGRELHDELFELNRAVFFDTNPIPIKYMARRLGILKQNAHRLPMVPATAELEKRLDGVLANAGLL